VLDVVDEGREVESNGKYLNGKNTDRKKETASRASEVGLHSQSVGSRELRAVMEY